MALIVEKDTVNPSRINITGDGFSFDVDGLGTRINITGVGRTVTVTYADPRANIQWGGNLISSSSFIGGLTGWRGGQQHHMPGEIGHSMKSVTNLTGLYIGSSINNVSFTNNYLFFTSNTTIISRYGLNGGAKDIDLSGDDVSFLRIIAYTDDITYAFGMKDTSFVIYKIDWTTEPVTGTLLDEIITDSPPYITDCCSRARNGSNDVFVCTGKTQQVGVGWGAFILLFNLNTDTVISYDELQPANYPDTTIWSSEIQTIAQNGNNIACIAGAQFDLWDVLYCGGPIIYANIETGVITLTSLPEYTVSEETRIYEYVSAVGYINSAMNNQTGDLYYLSYYNSEEPFIESTYMRRVSPPIYSPPGLVHDFEDTGIGGAEILHYGDRGTVAFRIEDESNNFIKIVTPEGAPFCTLDISQEDNYGAIDDENEMYWTVDVNNNKIVGKSFGTGGDRDIIVDDWGLSPLPTLYGRGIIMFNGYAAAWAKTSGLPGTVYFWLLYPTPA